jgi:hypothetical protein
LKLARKPSDLLTVPDLLNPLTVEGSDHGGTITPRAIDVKRVQK